MKTPKTISSAMQAMTFSRRATIVGGLQIGIGVLLAGRMTYISVAENERYKLLSESNRVNLTFKKMQNRNFQTIMPPYNRNLRQTIRTTNGMPNGNNPSALQKGATRPRSAQELSPLESNGHNGCRFFSSAATVSLVRS